MAEEDYDIDVYGDAQDGGQEHAQGGVDEYHNNDQTDSAYEHDAGDADNTAQDDYNDQDSQDGKNGNGDQTHGHQDHGHDSPSTAAPQHGVKRKVNPDERPVDPNATNALLISDLQWWNTEDELRAWVNEANCEDELRDITFSEHKVNGKSKGCDSPKNLIPPDFVSRTCADNL